MPTNKDNLITRYNIIKDFTLQEGYNSLLSQYNNQPDTEVNIENVFDGDEPIFIYRDIKMGERNLAIMMNQLNDTKFLFIDTETTGLDFKSDTVWQLAMQLTDFDFNVIETYNFHFDISQYGYDRTLYPIDDTKLKTYQEALTILEQVLETYKPIVIGHNLYFDLNMLERVQSISGYRIASVINKKLCTYNNRWLFKEFHLPNAKLETISKYFGIDTTYHHDAYFDTTMLREVLINLRRYSYV